MPTVLRDTVLNKPDYSDTDLAYSRISDCVINAGDFSDADLREAEISDTVFNAASFRNADLRSARFSDCRFNNCTFTGALTEGMEVSDCVGFAPPAPKRKRERDDAEPKTAESGAKGRPVKDDAPREKVPMSQVLHQGKGPGQGATRPTAPDQDDKK